VIVSGELVIMRLLNPPAKTKLGAPNRTQATKDRPKKGFSSFKILRYQRVGQLQLPFTDTPNKGTEEDRV
jgi:hypothetical protein